MSDTLIVPEIEAALPAGEEARRAGSGGSFVPLALWLAVLGVVHTTWWAFSRLHGWTAGFDITAPEYAVWMTLFYTNTAVIGIGLLALFWFVSRDCATCVVQRRATGTITARHEEHHVWMLWTIFVALAFEMFWAVSFFGESEAVWRQLTTGDGVFSPPHILQFSGTFPLIIGLILAAFLYARRHLGHSVYRPDKGFPLGWLLMLSGALTLAVQMVTNEWGPRFWVAEEIFAAPPRWPLLSVLLLFAGWFAVVLQTLARVIAVKSGHDVEVGEATTLFDAEVMAQVVVPTS